MQINVVSYAYAGTGTEASGGDKIFVEFAKRWARKSEVHIYTLEEGYKLCRKNGVEGVTYKVVRLDQKEFLFPILYTVKTIRGCIEALRVRSDSDNLAIYSSSDFWPDAIPAFIMKKMLKNAKWVAGFYLFAPRPLRNQNETGYRGGYAKLSLTNLIYYFSQQLIYRIMKRNADFIVVANELDKRIFVKDGFPSDRIEPIYGGVDIGAIRRTPTPSDTKYDGCFVGRLHPQKGPLELIRIWKLVCTAKPDATLALVGEGPLENEIRDEIGKSELSDNIFMLGWVEGQKKYKVLKSSKVFLHTPVLDTGGMAAAEGMACGLPVVAFDLPGYLFSYPRGMIKVQNGDIKAFANAVIELLRDQKLYDKISKEALSFSLEWDWDSRALHVLNEIELLFRAPHA